MKHIMVWLIDTVLGKRGRCNHCGTVVVTTERGHLCDECCLGDAW